LGERRPTKNGSALASFHQKKNENDNSSEQIEDWTFERGVLGGGGGGLVGFGLGDKKLRPAGQRFGEREKTKSPAESIALPNRDQITANAKKIIVLNAERKISPHCRVTRREVPEAAKENPHSSKVRTMKKSAPPGPGGRGAVHGLGVNA